MTIRALRSSAALARGSDADDLTVRRIHNAEQWDRIVQSFQTYDVKQGFAWGELRGEHGWTPARIAVFRRGDPVAACAILLRSLSTIGSVIDAPSGPLYRADDAAGLTRLLDEILAVATRARGVFVRLSPGVTTDDVAMTAPLDRFGLVTLDEPWTTWNPPRRVQVLDLRPDEATLLGGIRRRVREYIAAATRKGVHVEASDRDEDVDAFHALMLNVGRLKRFPVRDLPYYQALVRRYRAEGAVTMLVARAGNAFVGGLLAIRFGRRAYLLYTSVRSTTPDALKHHVAPAIVWEFIRRAKGMGCDLADFGGTGVDVPPQPSDDGYGVYHFKAGFGCRLENFVPFHDLVLRPGAYRLMRLAEARLLPHMWTLASWAPSAGPWRVFRAFL